MTIDMQAASLSSTPQPPAVPAAQLTKANPTGDWLLVLLPALGTDARLFRPQYEAFGQNLLVPPWVEPMRGETLSAYAYRMADEIRVLSPPDLPRLFIGGVSFGGMVALEAAPLLKASGVFLIASSRDCSAVSASTKVAKVLSRPAPGFAARWVLRSLAQRLATRENLSDQDAEVLVAMAENVDEPMLKWGAAAGAAWGYRGPTAEMNVHQIHGRHDPVVPVRPDHCDTVIEDGRHLINLTHAEVVNDYIRQRIEAA